MELLRTLVVLFLSTPQVDAVLPPTAPIAKARSLLVQRGMSQRQVERTLGLDKYRFSGTVFTVDDWYFVYFSPDDGHAVLVHYLMDRQTWKLRLSEAEVKWPKLERARTTTP